MSVKMELYACVLQFVSYLIIYLFIRVIFFFLLQSAVAAYCWFMIHERVSDFLQTNIILSLWELF